MKELVDALPFGIVVIGSDRRIVFANNHVAQKTAPPPADDEPLANLFVGLKLPADNLRMLSEALELRMKQAEERGATISAQQQAIRELSTPVIEVWAGVVILPLIGTIDTARAGQITEGLLESIVRTQASVAIMDIAGVPVVDTAVANHLLKSAEASRMLGAHVVLTGGEPSQRPEPSQAGSRSQQSCDQELAHGWIEVGLGKDRCLTSANSLQEHNTGTSRQPTSRNLIPDSGLLSEIFRARSPPFVITTPTRIINNVGDTILFGETTTAPCGHWRAR